MKSKKELLKKSRLYAIIDKKTCGQKSLLEAADKIKSLGADIIQLRDKISDKAAILKDAYSLRRLLAKSKTLFIINDYLDIARITDADGIHLGQEDCSIKIARKILGKDKIIGLSCHSLKQAIEAQKQGADYIGIGPIFKTPTKPAAKPIGLKIIREIGRRLKIPFFAIGGIDKNNIKEVVACGAKRVAVTRAADQARDIKPVIIKA